ncbi:hypothetical protein BaRGS_00013453, partial [Batillaria attramentaria]
LRKLLNGQGTISIHQMETGSKEKEESKKMNIFPSEGQSFELRCNGILIS